MGHPPEPQEGHDELAQTRVAAGWGPPSRGCPQGPGRGAASAPSDAPTSPPRSAPALRAAHPGTPSAPAPPCPAAIRPSLSRGPGWAKACRPVTDPPWPRRSPARQAIPCCASGLGKPESMCPECTVGPWPMTALNRALRPVGPTCRTSRGVPSAAAIIEVDVIAGARFPDGSHARRHPQRRAKGQTTRFRPRGAGLKVRSHVFMWGGLTLRIVDAIRSSNLRHIKASSGTVQKQALTPRHPSVNAVSPKRGMQGPARMRARSARGVGACRCDCDIWIGS